MGDWAANTSMGDSPVISIDIYNDGTVRNGTSITAYVGLILGAVQGQSWWGLGVNISWGWYDHWGTWVQGQDIIFKSDFEERWGETVMHCNFTVDTSNYDAGSLRAAFCVYPNRGDWGNTVDAYFGYDAGYTKPVRGNVYCAPDKQNGAGRFEQMDISWDSFKPGNGNSIANYEIWRQEKDGSNWKSRSRITEIWTSNTYGNYVWNGLSKYPMYYIKNKATGKYIDVDGGILANNQPANTYPFNGTIAQRFSLEDKGDYTYMHVDDSAAHLLHVQNANTANNTPIVVYIYTGSNNSKWRFDKHSDGSYRIVPLHATDKCLDVNINNDKLTIFDQNNGDNQKWLLEDASDAWRNLTHRFNVVAVGSVGDTYSDLDSYVGDFIKNDRPTVPINLAVTPNQVNITQSVTLQWTASVDSKLRTSNTYEIEIERSRNGGAYTKVGSSVYSNTNSLTNYTGHNAYAQPGDLFRFRVRAYDYFDIVSPWSTYATFEIRKSGLNYASDGVWRGHYVYAVVNGEWKMCEVYTVKNNQWTQCVMS